MGKVFVTGAGGFLGKALVNALVGQGDQVVCLDHFVTNRPDQLPEGVEILRADVRDRAAIDSGMAGVDRVYHLAASFSARSLEAARSINVEGTRQVAEAAANLPAPPVFVFVSSLAAAGPNDQASRETDPCEPVSNYGRTKLEAEGVMRSLADRMPVTIVRPPCVFGTGDRNMLPLYQSVGYGWNFIISKTDLYSFLHVDDLVAGLLAAAQWGKRLRPGNDPESQGLYYLTDPCPVTFVELAELIAAAIEKKRVRHVRIPRSVCWLVGAWGEILPRLTGRKAFLNLDKMREGLAGSWYCDGSRAVEELDFHPAADLPTRLRETLAFYRSVDWL